MKLFGLTGKTSADKSDSSDRKREAPAVGHFTGIAQPFKKADRADLDAGYYTSQLDKLKTFPVRLLEDAAVYLQKINRLQMKPQQKLALLDIFISTCYPMVATWYNKFQTQENSLPEGNEKRNALIATIAVIEQLSMSYKQLYVESYSVHPGQYQKNADTLYRYAFRALELSRLEQRLRALRYQKLPKPAWQQINQIFFAQIRHNDIDQSLPLIGLVGVRKRSDKLRKGGVPATTLRNLYLSVQLFGLLDVTSWSTRLFHLPDAYLEYVNNAMKIQPDNGKELQPGWLITCFNSDGPPLFKRRSNMPQPAIRFDYTEYYNTLVRDHKEIGKQQFLGDMNPDKLSRPLLDIDENERIPSIELILMGLTHRERKQKRHTTFDQKGLSVYFGFKEVHRLLTDLVNPEKERVMESRAFVDTLAKHSALLAEDDENYMQVSWSISNFSTGGVLIRTDETEFSNPIHIDQLVAFAMQDNLDKPVVGYIRRMNRPKEKEVNIAIVRLSNYVEVAAVQTEDDMTSNAAKPAILIRDIRDQWLLIVKNNTRFISGQPLKLIRDKQQRMPCRLGEVVLNKRDFKVFEIRGPGLQ